ncbi:MAG: phage tail protein [Solirubrobacteraceae bacterium]
MHHLRAHRPSPALVISILALVIAVGGVASATIPGANGTIHACHAADGALRVIDPSAGGICQTGEEPLHWNSGAAFAAFGHHTGGAKASNGAECTLGQVLLSASPIHNADGLPADGQLLHIQKHQALFALLGTTYGGDGKTTFALPDLRLQAPNHMTYSICDEGRFPQRR